MEAASQRRRVSAAVRSGNFTYLLTYANRVEGGPSICATRAPLRAKLVKDAAKVSSYLPRRRLRRRRRRRRRHHWLSGLTARERQLRLYGIDQKDRGAHERLLRASGIDARASGAKTLWAVRRRTHRPPDGVYSRSFAMNSLKF